MPDARLWRGWCRCGKPLTVHAGHRGPWWTHPDGSAPCIDFSQIPSRTAITREMTKRAKSPAPSGAHLDTVSDREQGKLF